MGSAEIHPAAISAILSLLLEVWTTKEQKPNEHECENQNPRRRQSFRLPFYHQQQYHNKPGIIPIVCLYISMTLTIVQSKVTLS
jgi:hypothetical protein